MVIFLINLLLPLLFQVSRTLMAFRINNIFPNTIFLHAHCVADIKKTHLKDRNTIILILVDSVINTGKSKTVSVHSPLHTFIYKENFNLVALCFLANKYSGRSLTDTRNRLFSTVHLA
ncbi:uncharacterized protein BO88DRAFT_429988 [Aspergillus vadensis CBS 113365]|uniref:Secreted protein n=1 Tax=Aspergillus vadensis (strain CBS 113365 / IMI 142717 / IBT 24658) TaxID=1448311 RepID=A0A319AUF7_ASPVC|nr:hypothetical protein BO88DRAFT_429988 [Aspergillus vadensis CBS 113365]PYH63976.1 hypothetical protein BO88DRAFT_429988 [Aspergillus vadensis CBS 113365]